MLLYLIVPKKAKNVVLFVSSLVFYAWGEPRYVFLMVATITVGYVFGICLEKAKTSAGKRTLMIISTVLCLGVLAYFKYADFFVENINRATGLSVKLLQIALPIGISFYTFQLLSYLIDVYRGRVLAQRNYLYLATYINMFPQLIAGPIVRYSDIEKQLGNRTHSTTKIAYGIRRFVIGLGKKVLIANTLAEIGNSYDVAGQPTTALVWLYAISTALMIYFDFSGYSDMAIGLGSMLGFDFPENFNYPFIARSVTEFWRRWHMTLGSWFRDYLYIPLGGNRVNAARWILNIFIVWGATGFWHGASWNFVLWGLFFAVLLVLEKKLYGRFLDKSRVLCRLYMVIVLLVSFIIFDQENVLDGFRSIAGLIGIRFVTGETLGVSFGPFLDANSAFLWKDYLGVLLLAILGATGLPAKVGKYLWQLRKPQNAAIYVLLDVAEIGFLLGVFLLSVASLVNGSFNPFLYFRF